MTQEQWNRLKPIERKIVRMILEEGLPVEEVAKKLRLKQEEVEKYFAAALSGEG